MKFGHILVLLLSSVGIAFGEVFGEIVPADPENLDTWLKAGVAVISLTALVWIVQHLLRNTIPEQQKAFRETMDVIAERSEKHEQEWRAALNQLSEKCAQTQQRWLDKVKE